MKSKTVQIPRPGALVELVLREGALSGQAVIVASDDVEIRVKEALVAEPRPQPLSAIKNRKLPATNAPAENLDVILKRLIKLKPTKRATAVNSIEAMFQFGAPISKEAANKILEDLRQRGSLTIDEGDKIKFPTA